MSNELVGNYAGINREHGARRKQATMSNRYIEGLPPLPAKMSEWKRFLKSERTLNDLVEDIHKLVVDDPKLSDRYRDFLYAVHDEQAVEGSLAADNTMAAIMLREKAHAIDENHEVAKQKAATISKALGIIMRRYKASRKQRKQMLEGEIVPSEDNNND